MITVNAMGDNCPIPVIKTKKAIQALTGAETIEVLVDNETAVQNVSKMAASEGGEVSSEQLGEKEFKVTIHIDGGNVSADCGCEADSAVTGDTIIVVSSDRMGTGNDELGKVLMKSFFFAVTQLEELPKTIIFYNGGATLSVEGSECLEDLKGLAEQGVEIMTCGTCLDYYGVKDKLAVGTISNMYTIVETMQAAGKVIRP